MRKLRYLKTVSGGTETLGKITKTVTGAFIDVSTTDAVGGVPVINIVSTFTKATAIAHKAILVTLTYQPTGNTGTGVPIAIAGMTVLGASATHSGLYMWGVQGGIKFLTGSVIASSQIAAGRFVLEEAGTVTYTSGGIAGIYIDNLITSNMAGLSGNVDLMRIANHGGTMKSAVHVYGPKITNFLKLTGCTTAGAVGANIGSTAIHKTICRPIAIDIDGTTFYLLASTAPAAS